ncbi:MAG: hypothetical protein RIQ81_1676 [Pseudomonadota bacterium]
MAEGTALLRRHTGNCIEGSNPSLSAIFRLDQFRKTAFFKDSSDSPAGHKETGAVTFDFRKAEAECSVHKLEFDAYPSLLDPSELALGYETLCLYE